MASLLLQKFIFLNMLYDYDERKFLGSRRSSDYVLHCIIVAIISDGQCVSCVCVCAPCFCVNVVIQVLIRV